MQTYTCYPMISLVSMHFQITRFKEFLVRPALPKELERLSELAYNLLWSWDSSIRSLFRRLDPTLWREAVTTPS